MKILVTGSSGFIGQHTLAELSKHSHEVVVTSRTLFHFKDFDSSINYFQYFGSPDAVIHLAWEGLPNYKSLFHFEENLFYHYRFLKNLVVNGLENLTITGTCLEYGMREGCLTESMDAQPENPYAVAKDTLRRFMQELKKHNDFNLKWVRLFYMYGRGQNPNSLIAQLDKAIENNELVFNMSKGEQERDYLPVEKVAEYIVSIATQQKITGIINCSSGRPITVNNLVKDYLNKKGREIYLRKFYPYTDYEPMSFWGDNTILKSIL